MVGLHNMNYYRALT